MSARRIGLGIGMSETRRGAVSGRDREIPVQRGRVAMDSQKVWADPCAGKWPSRQHCGSLVPVGGKRWTGGMKIAGDRNCRDAGHGLLGPLLVG